MLITFSMGLMASLGHCVGMCSAVVVLLERMGSFRQGWRPWALAHMGRIASYGGLGLAAGALGEALRAILPPLRQVQGAMGFMAGLSAAYLAASILGWVPSPERWLGRVTRRWGRAMQRLGSSGERNFAAQALLAGILWGLLPCGLVFTALFTAALAGSPVGGAARMLAFGLGTVPALLGVRWVVGRPWLASWPRYAAALLMVVFGAQLSLRGLAAWGLIEHFMHGGVMLW